MQISLATQVAGFIGAMLILVAYIGHQMRWMNSRRAAYNLLNAVGSGILAYIALRPVQVGFATLEIVWAAVSIWALIAALRAASSTLPG